MEMQTRRIMAGLVDMIRGCTFSKKGVASAVYGEDSGLGLANHNFLYGFALAANV